MKYTRLFGMSRRLAFLVAFVAASFLFGRIALTHAAGVSDTAQRNTGYHASTSCGSWSVVSSPNANSQENNLSSVAAISPNDVWAVGAYAPGNALLEHWNGSLWTLPKAPGAGGTTGLVAVAAVASNNVWAVGSAFLSGGQFNQTWIIHWNGVKWAVVSSPNNAGGDNYLTGVTARAANDIWAVGHYTDANDVDHTLTEHWNGSQWSIVSSPNVNPGTYFNYLTSVAAISSQDVWAVGDYYKDAVSLVGHTLTEHWNGSRWSIVSSPNHGVLGSTLAGVSADASNDVWAVGAYQVNGNPSGYAQTLVERWDGTQWKVVASPNLGSNWNSFNAVIAIASNNVWATGTYSNHNSSPFDTLIQHWNGTQWSVVSSPNVGTATNDLPGIAHVPGSSQLWAVGDYSNTGAMPLRTLTEFYC